MKFKFFLFSLFLHGLIVLSFFYFLHTPEPTTKALHRVSFFSNEDLQELRGSSKPSKARGTSKNGKKLSLKDLMVSSFGKNLIPGKEINEKFDSGEVGEVGASDLKGDLENAPYYEVIRRTFSNYHYPEILRRYEITGACISKFVLDDKGKLKTETLRFDCSNPYIRAHFGNFIRTQFAIENSILKSYNLTQIPVTSSLVLGKVFVRTTTQNNDQLNRSDQEETYISRKIVFLRRMSVGDMMKVNLGSLIATPLGAGLDVLDFSERVLRLFGKKEAITKLPEDILRELKKLPDY